MRLIATLSLALLACSGLSACTPPQSAGAAVAVASTDLTKAEAAYASAKAVADMLVPLLSADKAALVLKAEAIAEKAFAVARAALTIADQAKALAEAQAATAQIAAATQSTPAN